MQHCAHSRPSTQDGPASSPLVHPHHDVVTREIRSWYTTSAPEIGLEVTEHWFGFLNILGGNRTRLIPSIDDANEVPAALEAAGAVCSGAEFTIMVDDRARATRLDGALRRDGCVIGEATTYLALVGAVHAQRSAPPLVIVTATEENLASWARVKLQSFADSESDPTSDDLAAEVTARRNELPLAEYQLAFFDGDAVSVLAHYPGTDQLVFVLGTRVPFRHRGIAGALLRRWTDAGTTGGCRSLTINARDGGEPAALYRRLGFVDEVYWYQMYQHP